MEEREARDRERRPHDARERCSRRDAGQSVPHREDEGPDQEQAQLAKVGPDGARHFDPRQLDVIRDELTETVGGLLDEGDDAVVVIAALAWRRHSAGKLNTAMGRARPAYELVARVGVKRRRAHIAQFAPLAGGAAPDAIVEFLDAVEQAVVRAGET